MNYQITMKKFQDGKWNTLYPQSRTDLIYDVNRDKNISEIISELEKSDLDFKNDISQNKIELKNEISQNKIELKNEIEKIKKVAVFLDDFPKLTTDTSDSERVQRALNSFENGCLILPMGELVFDKSVKIDHSKTTIQGSSRGTQIKIINNITAFESLSTERARHLNRSITNFVIKDITFKGVNKTGQAFKLTGFARGTLFENLFFENLRRTVEIAGCWSLAFRNCYQTLSLNGFVFGDLATGTHNSSHAVNDVLIDNFSTTEIRDGNDTGVAIYLKHGANVVITNSTLELCDTAVVTEEFRKVTIDGCYIEQINSNLSRGRDAIIVGTKALASFGVSIINSYLYNASILLVNTQNFTYDKNTTSGTLDRIIIIAKDGYVRHSTIRYDKEFGLRERSLGSQYGEYGMMENIYASETNYVARDLVLQNGWVTFEESTRGGLKAIMTSDGFVNIIGAIESGTAGIDTPVCVIPSGLKPCYLTFFTAVDSAGNFVSLSAGTNGNFVVRSTDITRPIFINIMYKAEVA